MILTKCHYCRYGTSFESTLYMKTSENSFCWRFMTCIISETHHDTQHVLHTSFWATIWGISATKLTNKNTMTRERKTYGRCMLTVHKKEWLVFSRSTFHNKTQQTLSTLMNQHNNTPSPHARLAHTHLNTLRNTHCRNGEKQNIAKQAETWRLAESGTKRFISPCNPGCRYGTYF